ncbi:hypothetical protein OO012_19755 [Rhodobacteraceae bacterium KMM 6894]|nr:hypothetical protein [Rhodobacteraceae bacterium KMM 6894]
MFTFGFFTAVYLLITLFALLISFDEQLKNGHVSVLTSGMSFIACLFWPITLISVAMVVSAQGRNA